jgi:hypothetical protein
MLKSLRFAAIAAAGAFVIAPTLANAWSGNLVSCNGPAFPPGAKYDVTVKPGMDCTSVNNKLQLKKVAFQNCDATTGGAPWAIWLTNKVYKLEATAAAAIDQALVDIKGVTFGTCNFTQDTVSANGANGTAKVTFLDSAGEKVKNAKFQAAITISGDVVNTRVSGDGLVTKGMGTGAWVTMRIGLGANNGLCAGEEDPFACCTGAGTGTCTDIVGCQGLPDTCNTAPAAPITAIPLLATPASVLRVDFLDNADCLGPNDPFVCCSGAGAGTC